MNDDDTEAALAVIREEERTPYRPDDAVVPDHAPTLLDDLARMVEESKR